MNHHERRAVALGWTDEVRERVGALWIAGKSGSEIVPILRAEFGLSKTRNSVIGVVHRLGLSGTRRQATHPKTNRAKAAASRQPRSIAKPKAAYVKFERTPHIGDGPRPPRAELRARAWTPLEGVPPVRLEDRPGDACRWPINVEAAEGETFRQHWCCGGHVHANGYCAPHYQLAHQAPRTATEKAADQVRRDKAFSRQRRAA